MSQSVSNSLEHEFQFYLDNQDKLVSAYDGKILVIKNRNIIGVFDDKLKALTETQKIHKLGTFLIQECSAGKENYTHYINIDVLNLEYAV